MSNKEPLKTITTGENLILSVWTFFLLALFHFALFHVLRNHILLIQRACTPHKHFADPLENEHIPATPFSNSQAKTHHLSLTILVLINNVATYTSPSTITAIPPPARHANDFSYNASDTHALLGLWTRVLGVLGTRWPHSSSNVHETAPGSDLDRISALRSARGIGRTQTGARRMCWKRRQFVQAL